MEKNAALCKQLTGAVVEFATEENLLESYNPFDTQMNEAMNTLVMKHVPKNKTYCKSTMYCEFEIDVGNGMEKCLLSMDKSCTKHQDYKKETCNKLKCIKAD
eukprot:15340404-Ditylum_brightwellii.AAC.1